MKALLLLAALAGAEPGPREWLWHIVAECVEPSKPDYCSRCLRPADGACGPVACEDAVEVWATSSEFVAIRDRKMCGCSKDFVHGLALPRRPVSGVEDPHRPDGLWSFAWTAAAERIGDEAEIVLAVNGPGRRTQDHLHVHLIRFFPGGRDALLALAPEHIASLEGVWDAAARHAERQGIRGSDYGVAVARGGRGAGYLVVADPSQHPETSFGRARCR